MSPEAGAKVDCARRRARLKAVAAAVAAAVPFTATVVVVVKGGNRVHFSAVATQPTLEGA